MERNNNRGKKPLDLTLKLGPSNQENDEALEENPELINNGYYELYNPNTMGHFQLGFGPPFVHHQAGPSHYFLYQGYYHYGAQNYWNPFPNNKHSGKYCRVCGRTRTPLWRKGPRGPQTLCNACGIKHMRASKKE